MISISLKKNLIKFSRCILILITYCLSLTSNTYSQTPPDLPAACLPTRFRMLDVAPNDNVCHCPPQSFCNQTVNFNGKTYQKLPGHIKRVCCPPTVYTPNPVAPLALTVLPPSKECDVHYYSQAGSSCSHMTFIGPRTARFCIKYNGATALNTCLAGCMIHRSNIIGMNPTIPLNDNENSSLIAGLHAPEWKEFNLYAQCINSCHTSNSGQAHETDLLNWILLDNNDNNSTDYIKDLKPLNDLSLSLGINNWHDVDDYIAANDPASINHFTNAKFYGVLWVYATVNQTTFPKFLNSTWNPEKLGHNYKYRVDNDGGEYDLFDAPPPNSPISNLVDYHVGKLQDAGYNRNLNAVTADTAIAYIPTANCQQYSDLNVCITTFNSDGSCDTCLSPDTKVSLANGSSKPIKELAVGDTVKATDDKTAIIERVVKLDWKELALYSINDGALKLTADHPVMTTKGWRSVDLKASQNATNYKRYGLESVDTLQIGDVIITENGNITVSRIMPEPVIKNGISYNLKLKGADSFYANGILVRSQH